MKPLPKLLSKTKLLRGYRCPKCIYLTIHQPELEAPITPETQALFDQGNEVGAMARQYVPGGTLIDNKPWDFIGSLAKTKALLAAGTEIIYEAAFEYLGCYARADIIHYSHATERWHIIEVKSTTKVKPEHIDDVGLQTWIIAKSGLPIDKISIMHLNPSCRYPDLSNLFIEQDVTEELRANYLSVQPKVRDIFNIIQGANTPETDIGPHCFIGSECGFMKHCWQEKKIPPISIFNLPGIRQRKWELYQAGMIDLLDPNLTDLTDLQTRVVHAYRSGEPYLDKAGIQTALATWQFPLVFLDFETINPAIPRYEGCGPFHHVPFQFSVHLWPTPDAPLIHIEFLHTDATDPRPTLIPALLDACGKQGSIVAYFGRFESERIEEMANYSQAHREALMQLIPRIVDPLPIIRDCVYDNAFAGSFSLKKVAPALLGNVHSYSDMAVADGGAAQRAFAELINEQTPAVKKEKLKQALLAYCQKDTLVMVELIKWLYDAIGR